MTNGLIVLPADSDLLATVAPERPIFPSAIPPWSAWQRTLANLRGCDFKISSRGDEVQVDIEVAAFGATALDIKIKGDRVVSAWFRRDVDVNLAVLRAVAADNGALGHVTPSTGAVELVIPDPALRTHWPFAPRPAKEVATCSLAIRDRREPIRFAANLEDDAGWYFSDGSPFDANNSCLVTLESCMNLDPSIGRLSTLPMGGEASRNSPEDEWTRA